MVCVRMENVVGLAMGTLGLSAEDGQECRNACLAKYIRDHEESHLHKKLEA